MSATDIFLERIRNAFADEIPDRVYKRAKESLLDYIGVTLAGAEAISDKLQAYLQFAEPEAGAFTAVGVKQKMGLKDAVFLNGLNGHALDFDDGTNTGIIHLGSPIFSVLLPLAQKYDITYKKFLKAAVIGYETSFTMAVSIQPGHKEMGYHATGTCGVLGIALAVAHMLDFTEEQTRNAFSAACVSASGMLKVLDDGAELKPYNVAKSALLGLTSVQMAQAGFTGHPDPLGGFRGFLKMMIRDEKIELKNPLLHGTYAVEKTYTKPYAACRYCHPAIEAAISMRAEYGFRISDISAVEVKTYYWAVDKHDHTVIPGPASAKMSIPYGVAAGLVYGKAGLREYDPAHVKEREVLDLAAKVTVRSDEALTAQFPEKTSAVLKLSTYSGKEYTKRVDFPKGEPENPLSDREFADRFLELAVYGGKTETEAGKILDAVENMNGSMEGLFEYLSYHKNGE